MSFDVAKFDPAKGAKCQMRKSGAVPVCAVTSLKHNEILFSNENDENGPNKWLISGATIYLQRFWSTSTATITLTTALRGINERPPELPTYSTLGFKHRLQPDDEICIYLGYLDALRPVTAQDIKDNRLLRVFVGVIDTITATGTPQGVSLMIQCRDRMRYLMDTITNMSPFGADQGANNAIIGTVADNKVTRSKLMLTIAQVGIGYVQTQSENAKCDIHGKKIDAGFIQDIGLEDSGAEVTTSDAQPTTAESANNAEQGTETTTTTTTTSNLKPPDFFYRSTNVQSNGYVPLVPRFENVPLDLNLDPKFNMYIGRLGFETEKLTKNFQIENQIPAEFIKFLGNQEPAPTELFMNHWDGDYYYAPRKNDSTGLFDPRRFYRTYYYRNIPEQLAKFRPASNEAPQGLKVENDRLVGASDFKTDSVFNSVDKNQMAINFKEEISSIALKTNFIVLSSSPSGEAEGPKIAVHLTARPSFLRGLPIAGRNYYVIDETIGNPTEAAAVAASLARIHSKEVKAASMTVLGDPSFVPGEVIQVLGSPLNPKTLDIELAKKEREAFIKFEEQDNAAYMNNLELIRRATDDTTGGEIKGTLENAGAKASPQVEDPNPNKVFKVKQINLGEAADSFSVMCAITRDQGIYVEDGGGGSGGNSNNGGAGNATEQQQQQPQQAAIPTPEQLNTQQQQAAQQQVLQSQQVQQLSTQQPQQGTSTTPTTAPATPQNSPAASATSATPPQDSGVLTPDSVDIWRRSGFSQEPLTLWRVEGIRHQFNRGGQQGWTTELALLSVFS